MFKNIFKSFVLKKLFKLYLAYFFAFLEKVLTIVNLAFFKSFKRYTDKTPEKKKRILREKHVRENSQMITDSRKWKQQRLQLW